MTATLIKEMIEKSNFRDRRRPAFSRMRPRCVERTPAIRPPPNGSRLASGELFVECRCHSQTVSLRLVMVDPERSLFFPKNIRNALHRRGALLPVEVYGGYSAVI